MIFYYYLLSFFIEEISVLKLNTPGQHIENIRQMLRKYFIHDISISTSIHEYKRFFDAQRVFHK